MKHSSAATTSEQYTKAARLYNQRKMREALDAANELIHAGGASGYLIAGGVYEYGGEGLSRDFDKALTAYEMAIQKGNYTEGQLGAARVLIRKGGRQNIAKAMAYCERLTVDGKDTKAISYLTLGRIHEKHLDPADLSKARHLYLKAGFFGLASGFREYARLEYSSRSKVLGWLCLLLVKLIAPVMGLVLGKKTFRYK